MPHGRHRRHRQPLEFPVVELSVDGPSPRGGAIGRAEELVHFVSYALPGERVRAKVIETRGSFVRAEATEVLGPWAPGRVPAPCPYFGRCGGCGWQHARYARQLELKEQVVREQLARIGGFAAAPVQPMVGATRPYHYRNHVRLSSRRDGTLGFTREHTQAVMTIEHCHLVRPEINLMLSALQGHARGLHQVAIRHSARTGQSLVSPVVPSAPIATGQPWLEEELLGRRFRVSANAFFQVNTEQAEVLARLVLERLAPALGESILDAYCGVGTFALLAADRVGGRGRVVAIEEAGQAIADARVNAAGVSCVEIVQGRVERVVPRLDATFDGAVLDPARAGCERIVLDALIARPPRRIVYVSCDPATLARDLRILVDGGYRLVEVVPVDMFPQTFHIECVATLER